MDQNFRNGFARAVGIVRFVGLVGFVVMLIPLWKGKQAALPWLVAAVVSILVMKAVEGYAFIVVGALAGAIAGALMPEAQSDV